MTPSSDDRVCKEQVIVVVYYIVLPVCLLCRVGRALVMSGKKPNSKDAGYNVVNFGINLLSPTTKTDLANRCNILLPSIYSLYYYVNWSST